jgi:hypothetical protein
MYFTISQNLKICYSYIQQLMLIIMTMTTYLNSLTIEHNHINMTMNQSQIFAHIKFLLTQFNIILL